MVSQSVVSWVTKAWAWVFCFDTLEMSGARRRRRRNAKTKDFSLSANANNDSPWLLIVYNFLNINKVFNVKLNVFWKYSHHIFNNWLNVVRFNIKWIWRNKLFSVSTVGKLCFGNPRKKRVRRFFLLALTFCLKFSKSATEELRGFLPLISSDECEYNMGGLLMSYEVDLNDFISVYILAKYNLDERYAFSRNPGTFREKIFLNYNDWEQYREMTVFHNFDWLHLQGIYIA